MAKQEKITDKKTVAELQKILAEKRETLRVSRFGLNAGKTKNVKEVYTLRKDIARLLTAINQAADKAQ